MNKLFSRALLPAALVSPFAAHAAKPAGLVEKTLDATVASAGAFSQEYLFVTGSSYNPSAGSISASGLTSLFSNLSLSVLSSSGGSLAGPIAGTASGNNIQAKFTDNGSLVDLSPSTTYRLLVSGISQVDNASFGIRGVFVESIAAVPEPETYSMLLAGLGLIGAITFRRVRGS